MCNRVTIANPERVKKHAEENFEILARVLLALVKATNLAPTEPLPVVTRGVSGFNFELIPWGVSGAHLVTNARDDSLLTKPMFRKSAQVRRCAILADGFFEWEKLGKARVPHYIFLSDHAPFSFAGLYDETPQGRRAMIVTTSANTLMEKFHDRMPVILSPDDAKIWMSDVPLNADNLEKFCRPLPAEKMQEYRADSKMSSARYKGDDAIDPWKPAGDELALVF